MITLLFCGEILNEQIFIESKMIKKKSGGLYDRGIYFQERTFIVCPTIL